MSKVDTSILIADDHVIFRDGLRRLLEAEPGLKVVGEAGDGWEAVKQAETLRPDVLLLDLSMPRMGGLETLGTVSRVVPDVKVLLLTAAIKKRQIHEALGGGARGVVLKESATEVLLKSIRTVMEGGYWVGRESVADLVQYLDQSGGVSDTRKRYGLTPREMTIIAAIVSGLSNKEIAQNFSISEDTVKHHLTNIFDKLGVSTRLELALFAINHGVTEQE